MAGFVVEAIVQGDRVDAVCLGRHLVCDPALLALAELVVASGTEFDVGDPAVPVRASLHDGPEAVLLTLCRAADEVVRVRLVTPDALTGAANVEHIALARRDPV